MKIEICCGSFDDALCASTGGALRIELNSALHLGGLTPSMATFLLTKERTNLEIINMVRPRGGGFCYSETEYESMRLDAKLFLEAGADGIAFGFLTNDFQVDQKRTSEMVELIHSFGKTAVFHRAFDCTKNHIVAIETLIALRVDRLLTSGQADKATDGIPLLHDLQKNYGDKIEILVGSGVNRETAKNIIEKTGITQLHSSCKSWENDVTTSGNGVSFAYHNATNAYETVSATLVAQLIAEFQ